jgi:NAD(P)-dependent dehydrogenase (short-subunit alcohol dehydrogenase family)
MAEISLDGQVAIVTGAGRELGLGRAYALELARRGAAVVVNDVLGVGSPEGPAADRVVAEIEAAGGSAAASYSSVATQSGGEEITALALERFGTVDVVIHNAGAWRNTDFAGMTDEQIEPVLDVHLKGAFFVTRPAWQVMLEKGYGRVVLTSSPAGMFGRESGTNYAAAKAGTYGLCRALSLEGAERGVLTNCVLPIAGTMAEEERSGAGRILPPDLAAASAALRYRDEPARVAALVAYLSSSACTTSGEAYAAIAGHYARVLVGVTSGWLSPTDRIATAEEIAERWSEIEDPAGYSLPSSVTNAMERVAETLRLRDRA